MKESDATTASPTVLPTVGRRGYSCHTESVSGESRLESGALNVAPAARISDSKLARASILEAPIWGLFLAPMTLPYFPSRGEILVCDFNTGFREPEMIKKRPVIVVSQKSSHSRRLCTVVPLSTTSPAPVKAWHHALPHVVVPGWKTEATMWAKCDMLSTVGFERLNKPYIKSRNSGRRYVEVILGNGDLTAIDACMRAYLSL
ncbi:type II toxin-antitoxin system PemK/MazF family toxin [Paraburkholderia sartisoli]|uniref:Uncharacterized protein YifN, PemK superfamily n=1 Tax=Paraburkholderia sartisoli TaxID=83784 RepID=A0A1H3Z5A6_9BURK|nr:type II toxin-antitoxin system PemK/MazF family toxin [Paraburkholderia sartisoli]SEA18885.1 Uncharacterized protein YifN, PemK superfamily [Paraburkholderia sartisoli]